MNAPSLFDSDDDGGRGVARAPSGRAPAKARLFKRPPAPTPTVVADEFPQLPTSVSGAVVPTPLHHQQQYGAPPQTQYAAPPPLFAPPAQPQPVSYGAPAQPEQFAAGPPGHVPPPQFAPAVIPQVVFAVPPTYATAPVAAQMPAPNLNDFQQGAHNHHDTPVPTSSSAPSPASVIHQDAMTNFLQQPLAPLSPQHAGPQHVGPSAADDQFGSPNPIPPSSRRIESGGAPAAAAQPGAGDPPVSTAAFSASPSMAGFLSPRRSVSMKALPSVRMAHTPLGQVQLPAMPPVTMPAMPDASQNRATDESAAWAAFTDLRRQMEDSHQRTVGLHAEISRMQIAHEKEASALQASVQAQLNQQSRELQDMSEHYNSATAKVDQLSGLLARKAEELMRAEQKLHSAELNSIAMAQKVAHVEDRVKLADHARQVAEVRTRELELSLEHATTLIQSLRRQLSVANDEKTAALAEQYNTFEMNRQQLIHFYAEREQFMMGSYTESLNAVQRSMQEYLRDREAEVEGKWEDTYRTQLDHHKSLHEELVKRADAHVAEIGNLKEAHAAEMDKVNAALQREIRISDERWTERERNLIDDIARRERELSEREQRMRANLAQAEQDVKIALFTREAEMKSQFDRLLEEARHEFEKDRERLATAYREQLSALSAQHLANERELERLHREKEREMAQRYRLSNWEDDERRSSEHSTSATARTQDVLLAKMDKMQADQEARRLAMRTRLSATAATAAIADKKAAESLSVSGTSP